MVRKKKENKEVAIEIKSQRIAYKQFFANIFTIKKIVSISITVLSLVALSIHFNFISIPMNIQNNTITIVFNPVESNHIDKQEINLNQNGSYSSLPFLAILSKDKMNLNPDVVFIANFDLPPERFDPTNVHDIGTLEIRMKPEWSGDDNAAHYFVDIGENLRKNRITLYKDKDNTIKFRVIDKTGKEYLVYRYVGNKTKSDDIGLDWKPNQWYFLAATWDFNNGELELFSDKSIISKVKYGKISFDTENSYQFILGNGLEIKENPDWGKSNCKDFNDKCGFWLDELVLWKNKRAITQLITDQFIAQYTSNVIEFSKNSKFQELSIISDNPIGTSFVIHSRSSKDGLVWSNWELSVLNDGKYIINSPEGRFLQLELLLSRSDINKTISLDNIKEIELKMNI